MIAAIPFPDPSSMSACTGFTRGPAAAAACAARSLSLSARITSWTPGECARSYAMALPIIPDPITSAFISFPRSFQNLPRFHAPEEEVELVERYADLAGIGGEFLLDGEVALRRERLRDLPDGAGAHEVFQNVPVEDRKPAVADVPEEMR